MASISAIGGPHLAGAGRMNARLLFVFLILQGRKIPVECSGVSVALQWMLITYFGKTFSIHVTTPHLSSRVT